MRVLLAPDKFKGTFSAAQACEALAAGLRAVGAEVDAAPMADGGEGTAAVLLDALGGEVVAVDADDALGRPVSASYVRLADSRAVVEVAAASGLWRLADDERDALSASSHGTGVLIAHAARAGARAILVACGGSATTDGGAGMLRALEGVDLPALTCVCDVRTPWERAPAVFGPQKGADPADVAALEARLDALAAGAPRDPRGKPMTGCAGGVSGALWAWHGATLAPGAAFVADALGLADRMRRSQLAVTGEGRLDDQTAEGKVVAEVARLAARAGVPCDAVVGRDDLGPTGAAALGLRRVSAASSAAEITAAAARLGAAEPGAAGG